VSSPLESTRPLSTAATGSLLLVDDDPESLWLLATKLRKAGHRVTECSGGVAAVELARNEPYDLVILDLVMPDVDGFETLRRLRLTHDEVALPVIVVTVNEFRDDVVRCLDLGANDYVTKPVDWPILMARIRSQISASRAARREVAIGAEIQQALLIGTPSTSVDGLQAAVLTVPSRRVDGDFYEFYEHGNEMVDVIVGDVMGKGVAAALLGAGTKKAFGQALAHFLARRRGPALPRLERIVEFVNARIGQQLIELRCHVALSMVRIDLKERKMTVGDCGHTPFIHWKQNEKRVVTFSGESMPLGFGIEDRFEAHEFKFEVGDIVVFYTDGLTEARDPDGNALGIGPVIQQLEANAGATPQAILAAIDDTLRKFSRRPTLEDDMTCAVIKFVERSVHPGSRTVVRTFTSLPESLRLVRNAFRDVMCYHADGDRHPDGDALELAVNEVAANIIEHAHERDPAKSFEITFQLAEHSIEIVFRFAGKGFNRSDIPKPALNGEEESGYGLFIIDEVVDQVSREAVGPNEQIVRLKHSL
jgi:sigma-B regulation protein RsbU (phosphoserine phosphatase)